MTSEFLLGRQLFGLSMLRIFFVGALFLFGTFDKILGGQGKIEQDSRLAGILTCEVILDPNENLKGGVEVARERLETIAINNLNRFEQRVFSMARSRKYKDQISKDDLKRIRSKDSLVRQVSFSPRAYGIIRNLYEEFTRSFSGKYLPVGNNVLYISMPECQAGRLTLVVTLS